MIEAVLLRPYPFRDQSRLAILWQTDVVRDHPFVEISYLDARDWAARTSAFASIASMSSVNFPTTLTGVGDPRQLQVRAVSHPFFEVLGSAPMLGRTLTADDHRPESAKVVVIGYGVWQILYGGDPDVVGRSMVARQRSAHDRRRHAARLSLSRGRRSVGSGRASGPCRGARDSQSAVDGRSRTAGERRLVRASAGGARR